MVSKISELATSVGFKGTAQHKIAEPSSVSSLQSIDNSVQTQSNIRTSVDCYVSGQYVQRNGKIIEVTQRYTIFVAYSKETQMQTMTQVRSRIIQDFEARYGNAFNVSTVYVPQIPVPKTAVLDGSTPGDVQSAGFYKGTDMFREMTKYEKMRYDVGGEREKSTTNIRSIRKRYGYR